MYVYEFHKMMGGGKQICSIFTYKEIKRSSEFWNQYTDQLIKYFWEIFFNMMS